VAEIGVGVVGCGFVGRGAHVPAFANLENSFLAAVADPDQKRLNKVAKKYDGTATYQDFQELVQDPKVEAVVVSLPTPLHAKAALAAIAAGKHVLCEMPLAASLEEAEQIIEAADKAGVLLMPGLTFRFTPNYVKAKQLFEEGRVGALSAVMYREFIPAQALAGQWPAGSWVWNLEASGGPLFTLAVWSIDLMRWLMGTEIASVHATCKYTKLEQLGGTLGYDAFASLQFANGVVGCLQYSGSVTDAASVSKLELIGDNTSVIEATNNDLVALLGQAPTKTEWNVKQPGPAMWGHLQQDEHFVNCIRDGAEPIISPDDGRKAMQVAQQIATTS
jgi:predicted dehydrogenase